MQFLSFGFVPLPNRYERVVEIKRIAKSVQFTSLLEKVLNRTGNRSEITANTGIVKIWRVINAAKNERAQRTTITSSPENVSS